MYNESEAYNGISASFYNKLEKIVCPECGSEHLKKWNPKTGKCPKCGGEMEKTDTVLMVD